MASGLWLRGWRFGAVDIYAGKGIIDVGNYIFPFVSNKLSIWKRRGCRDLDTDDSVGGLWSLADPS